MRSPPQWRSSQRTVVYWWFLHKYLRSFVPCNVLNKLFLHWYNGWTPSPIHQTSQHGQYIEWGFCCVVLCKDAWECLKFMAVWVNQTAAGPQWRRAILSGQRVCSSTVLKSQAAVLSSPAPTASRYHVFSTCTLRSSFSTAHFGTGLFSPLG